LKPANFLFNDQWHLILADFGTAKYVRPANKEMTLSKSHSAYSSFSSSSNTRNGSTNDMQSFVKSSEDNNVEEFFNNDNTPDSKGSFVGTEDYVAPEIINN
jgi:serine/threonine protein kinase